MTVQFIDNLIYTLFIFEFVSIPGLIIGLWVWWILNIKIRDAEKPTNYLGKGAKKWKSTEKKSRTKKSIR